MGRQHSDWIEDDSFPMEEVPTQQPPPRGIPLDQERMMESALQQNWLQQNMQRQQMQQQYGMPQATPQQQANFWSGDGGSVIPYMPAPQHGHPAMQPGQPLQPFGGVPFAYVQPNVVPASIYQMPDGSYAQMPMHHQHPVRDEILRRVMHYGKTAAAIAGTYYGGRAFMKAHGAW